MPRGQSLIPLMDRIQLDEATGCWNWRGAKVFGYGVTSYQNRQVRAHRLAMHLWRRMDIRDPRAVLHRCDNPSCFNPKHLFLGTQLENIRDMVSKGRHCNSKKAVCKIGHPLSGDNIRLRTDNGGRRCIACEKLSGERRLARKKLALSTGAC